MRPDMLDLKMDNIEEDSPAFQTASYRHIVQESNQLKMELIQARQQRDQARRTVFKQEGEILVLKKQVDTLQANLMTFEQKGHQYLLQLEQAKRSNTQLIEKEQNFLNSQLLVAAELHKLEQDKQRLQNDNSRLKKQLEDNANNHTTYLREKQNVANQLVLAQAKLAALTSDTKYTKDRLEMESKEKQRLQEEVDALNAKLAQNSKTEVKTIIKDDQETKGLLLAEFQEKIRSMEEANTAEKAEYQLLIKQLRHKVEQLETKINTPQ